MIPKIQDFSLFDLIDNALLDRILRKLSASSFASAACVSMRWYQICDGILFSRPKLLSAVSLCLLPNKALQEVVKTVCSEPIKPQFVLAHVAGPHHDLSTTLDFLVGKFSTKIPIIVTRPRGLLGKTMSSSHPMVLLVIGYLPGLKVAIIPFREVREAVNNVKQFSHNASGCSSPSFIMMFGSNHAKLKPIIDILDEEMSDETIIAGNEGCEFSYNIGVKAENDTDEIHAVTLVFSKDMRKRANIGEVGFHVGFLNGLFPAGPVYQAVSCQFENEISRINGKRDGLDQIFTGIEILSNLGLHLPLEALEVVEVAVARNASFDDETGDLSLFDFYGKILESNDQLHVWGSRVHTGDYFQLCVTDQENLEGTGKEIYNWYTNLKEQLRTEEFIGGFLFTSNSRGNFFYLESDLNSATFLDNFPVSKLIGIFCSGEIVRGRGFSGNCFLNKYSSVHIGLFYSP